MERFRQVDFEAPAGFKLNGSEGCYLIDQDGDRYRVLMDQSLPSWDRFAADGAKELAKVAGLSSSCGIEHRGPRVILISMDDEIPALADAIYREKVLRARSAPITKKMGWGAELFVESCSRMRSGIRSQFPDSTAADVERVLRERLDRLSRLHEHRIFVPVKDA